MTESREPALAGPGVLEGAKQNDAVARTHPVVTTRDRPLKINQRILLPMLLLFVTAWVIWQTRDVLPPFVLAMVVAYMLSPAITGVHLRLRIPRPVVAVGLYLSLIFATGAGIALLEPHLVRQTRALVNDFPKILRDLFFQSTGSQQVELFGVTIDAEYLARATGSALATAFDTPRDLLHVAERVLQTALDLIVFLVALLYVLVDGPRLSVYVLHFVPAEHRAEAARIARDLHQRLSRYLQGQLLLVILMALASWFVLHVVFHLRFAIPVAIATGFLEVIPFVGPIVATTLATSLALWQLGLHTALGVLVAYVVLRQLEDQVVMPIVLGRAVELHPLVIIFAVLAGERIAGVLGMLLAVPVAAAGKVLLDVWGQHRAYTQGGCGSMAARTAENTSNPS